MNRYMIDSHGTDRHKSKISSCRVNSTIISSSVTPVEIPLKTTDEITIWAVSVYSNSYRCKKKKLHVAQYVILLYLFFQTNLNLQMTISWNNLCLSVHIQSLIPGIVQSLKGHSKTQATICIVCWTEY